MWYGKFVNNVEKCDRNINHPFEKFIHVKSAQNAFQEASLNNQDWSLDECNLRGGCISKAFTAEFLDMLVQEYDTIISDSSTCTAESQNQCNLDRNGNEFWNEL